MCFANGGVRFTPRCLKFMGFSVPVYRVRRCSGVSLCLCVFVYFCDGGRATPYLSICAPEIGRNALMCRDLCAYVSKRCRPLHTCIDVVDGASAARWGVSARVTTTKRDGVASCGETPRAKSTQLPFALGPSSAPGTHHSLPRPALSLPARPVLSCSCPSAQFQPHGARLRYPR